MDILGSREVDYLSDIKQDTLHACLNEYNKESNGDEYTNQAEELLRQRHRSIPPQKCLRKCASTPSSVSPLEDDDELGTALQRIFLEDSVQLPYSRSFSLPNPLKLVSALKGSREKQGLPPKKLTVTWAPDVYDPLPTSVLHTVRGKRQPKSKKNNNKKKNGKKGKKGNNSSRGSSSSKDKKLFSWAEGNSNRCFKPLEVQDRVVNATGDLDGFNIGSPDPYCGSSFLKNSPTRMHYSVTEAL